MEQIFQNDSQDQTADLLTRTQAVEIANLEDAGDGDRCGGDPSDGVDAGGSVVVVVIGCSAGRYCRGIGGQGGRGGGGRCWRRWRAGGGRDGRRTGGWRGSRGGGGGGGWSRRCGWRGSRCFCGSRGWSWRGGGRRRDGAVLRRRGGGGGAAWGLSRSGGGGEEENHEREELSDASHGRFSKEIKKRIGFGADGAALGFGDEGMRRGERSYLKEPIKGKEADG
ncbi:hypothetical protein KSP39_PZI009950 [Platanthera zijinensis]|uniref:Uncharacterized protein n=1 Tax=Platanthera zijinensis TaxID=2320716 RepID=A0AAP0BJU0_9ASPA